MSDRLSRSHVLIIGFVIMAAIAAGAVFGFVRPTTTKRDAIRKQRDDERAVGEQLPQAQLQLAATQQALASTQESFRVMLTKMPTIRMGPGDPADAMEDLWNVFGGWHHRSLGDDIVREFRSRGATVTALTMPAPPGMPPAPVDVIRIEEPGFGVTVHGGFPAVLKLLTGMGNMNRLMGIHSVAVTGVSPTLQVNMPAVIFLVTGQVEKNVGVPPAAKPATSSAG